MLVLGLVDIPWWAIMLIGIASFLIYDTWDFNYFKKQNIPGPRPYPIMGTMMGLFKMGFADAELANFEKYKNYPCYGEFFGSLPAVTIFDDDMLSEVMVKQFSSFPNRLATKVGNPLNDGMLINLLDAHWKHVRSEMSPTFTSGKLKKMSAEINRCGKILAESLLEAAKEGEEVELSEFTGGFAMDVIASTAFGIRVDSQRDRNNAFVDHARRAFLVTPTNPIFIMILFFPKLTQLLVSLGLKVNIFSTDTVEFFSNIVRQTMEIRKAEKDQSRSDFLQLMIKAQRGENIDDECHKTEETATSTGLSTDEILGNAMLFFIAGYDTTANALTFFLYNMAINYEVQKKLVQEINDVMGDKENVDTNIVQEMPYLDMCVCENLRLYSPFIRVNRIANQDVTVKNVYIKKGVIINVPILAIHRDPNKWPKPETFDPERFSAENKRNRNPYHFLPFGNGPRNCIGMRLALQELKVAIVHVLRVVKVTECHKTMVPLQFDKSASLLKPLGGVHVKVEPRKE